MSIPINGRIAIIDDQIVHAEPLMKVFSKMQVPFTYFSGEVDFLPAENRICNDFRVLFLDINLIDNRERPNRELKSKLIPVLSRIISKNNFPYMLIYWSRHEHHRELIEHDIFGNDLINLRPIAYLSAVKSDFFDFDGNPVIGFNTKIERLFKKIINLLGQSPAFNYLLNWENYIHHSADKTLEQLYSNYKSFDNWIDNANYVMNKLGTSYSGKQFIKSNNEEKIKSSYKAMNSILFDTIENTISLEKIDTPRKLKVSSSATNLETINNINRKLLTSSEVKPISLSGIVFEVLDIRLSSEFEKLLEVILKNTAKKSEIILSCKKIWINVTPVCDSVQNKVSMHRLVKGLLVQKSYLKSFHNNESIFISPSFTYDSNDYFIVLDFRNFFTLSSLRQSKKRNPIFRLRQQLLAEIQSKLARHISRQGILYLD